MTERIDPKCTINAVLTPEIRQTIRTLLSRATTSHADAARDIADVWNTIDPQVQIDGS